MTARSGKNIAKARPAKVERITVAALDAELVTLEAEVGGGKCVALEMTREELAALVEQAQRLLGGRTTAELAEDLAATLNAAREADARADARDRELSLVAGEREQAFRDVASAWKERDEKRLEVAALVQERRALVAERDELRDAASAGARSSATAPAPDVVRVLRMIEYVGPREMVERTVQRSLHGTRVIDDVAGAMRITGVSVGEYPERLVVAPLDPDLQRIHEQRRGRPTCGRCGLPDTYHFRLHNGDLAGVPERCERYLSQQAPPSGDAAAPAPVSS